MNQELADAYGEWFGGLAKWQWFVTLTFRDPEPNSRGWSRPGWAYAKRAWNEFTDVVRPAIGSLQYVRAFELQRWRGAPHIHALVAGMDNTQYKDVSSWYWRKYGFIRVLPYDADLGASYYIAKYVSKELGDFDFSLGTVGREG